MIRPVGVATAAVLGGLAVLHGVWGTGSAFPCRDRDELADVIAGSREVPPAPECFAVSTALVLAALLVADLLPVPRRFRRVGVAGAATVLGVRGALGVAGRTDLLVPWQPSDRFVRLDRRHYGPLCLTLAAGACSSLEP